METPPLWHATILCIYFPGKKTFYPGHEMSTFDQTSPLTDNTLDMNSFMVTPITFHGNNNASDLLNTLDQDNHSWIEPSVTSTANASNEDSRQMTPTGPLAYSAAAVIFTLGVLGNVCAIIIWATKDFRKMARSIVCICLACANTVSLIFVFGQFTTAYLYSTDFLSQTETTCHLKTIIASESLQIDAWLIVYYSVERVVALFKPHLAKVIFNRRNTVVYVLVITIVFTALNVSSVVNSVTVMAFRDGSTKCIYQTDTVLNLTRFLFMGPAPLIVVIPCNIIIIVKVIGQYLKMRNVVAVTQQQLQRKRSLKASLMTLSITVTYIASVSPQNVYLICCAQQGQLFPYWFLYFPMINGAVNFYMYTLSSEEYRRRVGLTLSNTANYLSQLFRNIYPNNVIHVAPIEEIELSEL